MELPFSLPFYFFISFLFNSRRAFASTLRTVLGTIAGEAGCQQRRLAILPFLSLSNEVGDAII
jgi:hypothetical protein